MKKTNTLVKWIAAAAAVAGIAYLVVRYFDQIHAWLRKLCPCCTLEDDFVVDDTFEPFADEVTEETPAAEESAQDAAPAEEVHSADTTSPVADETDFEEN